jgi:hypothetical protein
MSASAMLVRLIQMLAERISDEEALTQMVLCRERLLKQRQNILDGIANHPKADYRARVEASSSRRRNYCGYHEVTYAGTFHVGAASGSLCYTADCTRDHRS